MSYEMPACNGCQRTCDGAINVDEVGLALEHTRRLVQDLQRLLFRQATLVEEMLLHEFDVGQRCMLAAWIGHEELLISGSGRHGRGHLYAVDQKDKRPSI